jgi:putative ABC transport system permease protein
MLIHNLNLSIRNFKKNSRYSLINLFGFAAGFAVVLIITMFVYNEMMVDRNFEGHNQIFRVVSEKEKDCLLNFELSKQMKDNYPEVGLASSVQYLPGFSFTISGQGNHAKLSELMATDNHFFEIFNLKLVEGVSSLPFTELNSAVITRSLASSFFGKQSALGQMISIGGFFQAKVNGVVEDFPGNSSFSSQLFLNIANPGFRIMQNCNKETCTYPANIYIKLKPEFLKENLEAKINRAKGFENYVSGNINLQPLTKIYHEKGIKNNVNRSANTSMIYLFIGIAALILLLSIFNHVNFSISLQFSNLRETGIKKTNGAGFAQLAAFHFTENGVALLLSFFVAIGIVFLTLPLANELFDRQLDITALFKYPVSLSVLLILVLVIILTTIVPLYLVARFDVRNFLSHKVCKVNGGRLVPILSVFQITISVILFVGVLTIQKQLSYIKHADLGFEKEHLMRVNLPNDFREGDAVKQELSKYAFVKSATLSLGVPGMINSTMESGEGDNPFRLNCLEVDEGFIGTFGLRLIEGRNFYKVEDNEVCILNEAALKKTGWKSIDGKQLNNGALKVVGIVNDFHVTSLHNSIEPIALIFRNKYKNVISLRLEPGDMAGQIVQLKEAWRKVMPDYLFDFDFYDAYFNALYENEERLGKAISIFSLLAIIITLMGMSGAIFQTCRNRTKEIGIRKINGAKISEVMLMLNRDFVKWVAIAFAIATPVSWYAMNKWLESFAYKTELSWWIFALAGLLALGIALLTVSWQSWKAATRNPVEALRYE